MVYTCMYMCLYPYTIPKMSVSFPLHFFPIFFIIINLVLQFETLEQCLICIKINKKCDTQSIILNSLIF